MIGTFECGNAAATSQPEDLLAVVEVVQQRLGRAGMEDGTAFERERQAFEGLVQQQPYMPALAGTDALGLQQFFGGATTAAGGNLQRVRTVGLHGQYTLPFNDSALHRTFGGEGVRVSLDDGGRDLAADLRETFSPALHS